MTLPRKLNLPKKQESIFSPLPAFVPLHPAFVGRSEVLALQSHQKKDLSGDRFKVDLSANVCTCPHGKPTRFDPTPGVRTDIVNYYCGHKLRALATILEKAGRPPDMQMAYAKAVASRYNKYEVVSAFHKELRRGNVDAAIFWGHMLACFRSTAGVVKYMSNIIYEETRDHTLARGLLFGITNKKDIYQIMLRGIEAFCQATKKWELPHRMEIVEAEVRAYGRLIDKFGRGVAGDQFIAKENRDALFSELQQGIKKKDLVQAQYGLRGLQRTQCYDLNVHRAWIINKLIDQLGLNSETNHHLIMISLKSQNKIPIGHDDLNNLIESLCGEPAVDSPTGCADGPPQLKLAYAPVVPLYAHDNHTYAGKALLRRYPHEYKPGAQQDHLDIRLSGAYMGICWRQLAVAQHGRIDVPWCEVGWPEWMWEIASQMWY